MAAPAFNQTALYVYHGGAGGDSYLCGACLTEGYRNAETDPDAYLDCDIPDRDEWHPTAYVGGRDGCDDCGLAAMPNPNPNPNPEN